MCCTQENQVCGSSLSLFQANHISNLNARAGNRFEASALESEVRLSIGFLVSAKALEVSVGFLQHCH